MISGKLRTLSDYLLITLALISVGLLLLEVTSDLTVETLAMIRAIDLGVALIFGLEFLTRLSESQAKKKFMRENWWQILASIPVTASGTQILRGLMLIRIFRIVRFTSMVARISIFSKSLANILKETRMAWLVTLLGIVLFGGAWSFYALENVSNPQVNNFYDGFWFISEVMTNTGIGEVYPMTSGGRAIGILAMFSGIIIFGLFVAFISSYLVRTKDKNS